LEAFEQKVGKEVTTMYHWLEDFGFGVNLADLKRSLAELTDLESYLRDSRLGTHFPRLGSKYTTQSN
jgi:hypothetical protein